MEDLVKIITLVVIYVAWSFIQNILERRRKGDDPAKAEPGRQPGGLILRLLQLLERLREQEALASGQPEPVQSGPPARPATMAPPVKRTKPPARPAVQAPVAAGPTPAKVMPAPLAGKGPCQPMAPPGRHLRPRALRRAVVWSEILAPPVALRDEPPGRLDRR
ncbi:MAG: hypothetical protein AB1634_14135 [Thermodesulfobacteriota bacterium]